MTFEEALASVGTAIFNFSNNLLQRKWDTEDNRLKNLLDAADQIKQLTLSHKKIIDEIVSPALMEGDLNTTYDRYNKLSMEGNIPTGYMQVAGTLAEAEKYFKKGPVNEAIKNVRIELRKFRYAAYLLQDHDPDEPPPAPACYDLAMALNQAAGYSVYGSGPIPENQMAGVDMFGEELTKSIDLIHTRQGKPAIPNPELRTGDDVTKMVQEWCREWQVLVNRTLTEGHGLNYQLGRLQLQRRTSA